MMKITFTSQYELDKLIAEKIFGWADFGRSVPNTQYLGLPPEEQSMGIDAELEVVPHYSSSVELAWHITESFY